MSAVISACGRYRYRLTRGEGRLLPFVMLNPSTADAGRDDPTIRRCRSFSLREGYDGIEVMNLYAFRATDAADLWKADDPIGDQTGSHLLDLAWAHRGNWIVCGWGTNAPAARVRNVVALLTSHGSQLVCLGRTKDGHPRHPLYVRGDASIEDWSLPA